MEITSPAFAHQGTIPKRHTCDGADVSPRLEWEAPPGGTRSLVLIMDDPDAPPGLWVHWTLFNLAAETRYLPEDLAKDARLPGAARQGKVWGVDTFSRHGYWGPCPPPGEPHRYFFKIYALDTALALSPDATKTDLEEAMRGHVLAQGELIGMYGR